ncbi:MAG: galactose-1-phosphate uridylyltransferase [Candidatus Doudnabacteria bacterium RIFCSPHIGHO2_02_FULL_46_11]|uniref:Galactose-1-phosphate uridylyltransferase n=1 Tax=Candidatus Doudnabacteria bacterium RIFCSPHIGHO2_02_FULL_46_11 TaxID=1817832 RepID=A0A1F5P5D7_9BACT|nr:MAG: galactose-1-phosphate uridylyltransferase [Candidatus Doudnabacteria bacterium RIFCSPHIGHO2_02_FULL_46_11]
MSQFRQDNITKHWVLIAPKRALRPEALNTEPAMPADLPETDDACVFCPANDNLNPQTIFALPSNKKWRVRVIPNKFETLSHKLAKPLERGGDDFFVTRPGVGDHEVIIMAQHNKPLAMQDLSDIELAVKTWLARMNDLQDHAEVRYIHIIQNHGKLSGATVMHPHFQLFTLPFIPNHLQDEMSGAAGYYRAHDKCVYCEMIDREMKDGSRVVLDHKDFLVFALFASRVPFQLRIIPKHHKASFTSISAAEQKSLAEVLKITLGKIYKKLNNPSYNFYIHTIPLCTPKPAFCDPDSYHWHLEVLPRVNVWAGFELGTEIYVNPVVPEEAAKLLRS